MSFDVEAWADGALDVARRESGGEELICRCPDCGKPKLSVNAAKGVWNCWGCSKGGGPVALIAKIERITRQEAQRRIGAGVQRRTRGGQSMREAILGSRQAALPQLYTPLPEAFRPIFDETERRWEVPQYLRTRKVSLRVARRYGLGFCSEGYYEGRLILPARMGGQVRTWQARAMRGQSPKYLGPPKAPKAAAIFGLDEIRGERHVVVVEGALDVLRLAKLKIPAVAMMGKRGSHAQAVALHRWGVESVTLLLDGDAMTALARAVLTLGSFAVVKTARLPAQYDPDDAPRTLLLHALAAAKVPRMADLALP